MFTLSTRPATAAAEVLGRAGVTRPPVDPQAVAEDLDVLVVAWELPNEISGILMVDGGLACIGVNEAHPETRQRFTVAHELGHHVNRDVPQFLLGNAVLVWAGLFVASQNIKGGGGNCVHGCKGIYAFAMANPLTAPALTDVMAKSPLYMLAPLADQPNCAACVETFDTRISATPVYAGGLITFALESGVSNGTQVVPGVYWGQLKPVLSGATMHNAFLKQTGVVSFSGDQAASYGALMPDGADNVIMAFDTMSSTLAPGIEYAGRLASDPAGTFSTPIFVRHGSRTFDTSWGEYGATSYEGTATNKIWFAAEYGNTNGDWATRIASTHF